jgi:microsomal epoxide hydrolase
VTDFVPFTIDVPDAVLDDLRERLARARLPQPMPGLTWEQGIDFDVLVALLDHWRTKYDWRAHEARLNTIPQLVTEIEGQRIHLLHARSPHEDALPLLMMHGWPGSVVEFLDAIELLTDPPDGADAFHVIAPSLPGFGWSGPTSQLGWHPRRMAAAFGTVMEGLGYERYGSQGGDWGSIVACNVADLYPDRVAGLHLNFVTVPRPKDVDVPISDEEEQAMQRLYAWRRTGAGYQEQQGTKPQTIGFAIEDSPVGLAAWIVEKFHAWSDCGDDLTSSFTFDQLLTNVMAYWVTGTATSAARIYWEMRQAGAAAVPQAPITVPTGIANFPAEVTQTPRAWVERRYNVTHWTYPKRGGHFAAMEVPDLFADDVRTFFRTVR